jgi:N-acetylneuraminic acid mutarotase
VKVGSATKSAFFGPRTLIALLLCATSACTVLGFFRPGGRANAPQRPLTLEERVSYQRAIEEVYWRHRIWPKERPDPKPSFDEVIPRSQLEKKVADYLRNSQALEDYWQRPITAEQLQAELDRMAQDTRQPEVLHEIFEALGNDPFVIAECLARPALAERLITTWYAYDQRFHGQLMQHAEADLETHATVSQMKQLSGKYREIEFVKSDGAGDEPQRGHERRVELDSRAWDETVGKLAAMFDDTKNDTPRTNAVTAGVSPASLSRSIAGMMSPEKGTPITQIKTGVLSPLREDEERYYAIAVLGKTERSLRLAIVVWLKEPLESWLARVESQVPTLMMAGTARYTLPKIGDGGCSDDTWTDMYTGPAGRLLHTAVWTGNEMIIWGGWAGVASATGGRYNPSTDTWAVTSMTNAPTGRHLHTAVWTGNDMIVWGGQDDNQSFLNSGARYNPSADSWTPTAGGPSGRAGHTAVWTGTEMIVWGGYSGIYLNDGGRYNAVTNSWTTMSTIAAPTGRAYHTAAWTGSEMIVWGGESNGVSFNTGGRYNLSTDSWIVTSTTNVPGARYYHTAVWSGNEMIVWGGSPDGGITSLSTGGRYSPNTDSWTSTSLTNAPSARDLHTAIWTGSEMIVWGGFAGASGGYLNTGGRYNPSSNNWTATTTTNGPEGREEHTAVWTGSEMIVWGGITTWPGGYLNTGGRYDPSTDSWAAVGGTSPVQRNIHTAVWTGSEMIIWGGIDEFSFLSTIGGRYDPGTDSWTPTSTINAPDGRWGHDAVWTGSEMIVWGGVDESANPVNTGGRYGPGADSWTNTSTTNAPEARYNHRLVWTGSEMIVWGGFHDTAGHGVNTGGRYDPGTDSWTATSTTNAPAGRGQYRAVWTGGEMIVWGGCSNDPSYECLNTGGRYNPGPDSWTATTTINAPSARGSHAAVWSGNEMIIWGGNDQNLLFLDTGGRYDPSTDSWTATSTTNAPVARFRQAGVWTGNEMVIWGGSFYDGASYHYLDSGGRYNPTTNSWVATSTTNAPPPRQFHTAVWVGSEMIVWGGANDAGNFSTGGRYCAQSGPTPSPTVTPTSTPTATAMPRVTPRARPTPHPRATPR